jgi:hypothetical protein
MSPVGDAEMTLDGFLRALESARKYFCDAQLYHAGTKREREREREREERGEAEILRERERRRDREHSD